MQILVSRVLIGFGVIVAAVVAIGYAFVFMGIAAPPDGTLGRIGVPAEGEVSAAVLDDGTPVFAVAEDASLLVLDARAPRAAGEVASLVGWCAAVGAFHDTFGGGWFAADGTALDSASSAGLHRFETHRSADGTSIEVGPRSAAAGVEPGTSPIDVCPASSTWISHEPDPSEAFDPSVAADQEPPGWVWLEGRLEVAADAVRLCDGLEGACDTWAPVGGIDPARAPAAAGHFIGEVHDGIIEGLTIVPSSGGSS